MTHGEWILIGLIVLAAGIVTLILLANYKPNALLWFVQRGRRLLPKHLFEYATHMERKRALRDISGTIKKVKPEWKWDDQAGHSYYQ